MSDIKPWWRGLTRAQIRSGRRICKLLIIQDDFRFHQFVRSISRFFLRFLDRAELEQEPERDAALGLGFESPADIAHRSLLVGEDVRDRAHEYDVQRSRLTGEGFRQEGGCARVSLDQLRQTMLLCRSLYIVLFLCQSAYEIDAVANGERRLNSGHRTRRWGMAENRHYRSYRTRGVRVLRGPLFAQTVHRLDINVILSDPLMDRSGF